jgi:hypothetical protein
MPSLDTIKLLLAIAALAGVAIFSSVVTHKVDSAALLKQQSAWKDAELKAVNLAKQIQAAEDKVSLDAAVAEAKAQQQIVTKTITLTREVPIHVPLSSKCPVTVGFVRLLNAAILGQSTADLSYAPGKSDDACAPVDARALADNLLVNFAAANGNAEQLTALQAWVKNIIEASKGAANDKTSTRARPAPR